MVEINNQRKAFLDMLAWSEGTDNGRQENQKSWLWRHCRRRAIYWLLRSPSQTCHAKPKLKSTGADATSFFPVGGMPTASSLAWKTSLRKVRTLWHCSRLRSVALYLWLIVVISVRQSTVAAISGFTAGRWLWSFEHKADSLIAKFKEAGGNRRRDWCMSRVTAIISSALVICIIVCPSWAVNHYRDNAITYKAQRDKKCQRTEAGERGNYWHMQMRQRDVAAPMQNTRRS